MSFRLLDIFTGQSTEHPLTDHPPYLAASHAWSEQLFPQDVTFLASPGRTAILTTVERLYPIIKHCWVDTICIDQKDEDDKIRQIPLMGKIFGEAVAVLIILGCEIKMQQSDVDNLTDQLDGAVAMEAEEAWATEGQYWQFGEGRALIAKAMKGLARLTTTAWSTRVWTLQEYILARTVVWIGKDLAPLVVKDILFSALPTICDVLIIEECIGGEFEKLYSFFSGMANVRLRRGDQTRVMELLGNRKATVECDEVYGVMAASGVEMDVVKGENKEQAWARWVEMALSQGHLRWLLMPSARAPSTTQTHVAPVNCIVTPFSVRHKTSSGSGLDTVIPLRPLNVRHGTVIVRGRLIGHCQIGVKLGGVHEPVPNRIHRDITVILFTSGLWSRALRVTSALGAGRYNPRQIMLIAQAMIRNWPRAVRAVRQSDENKFSMKFKSDRQAFIWQDFMAFQMGQMPGMNEGIAYLATIKRSPVALDTVVVLAPEQQIPAGELLVFDVGGRTVDKRGVFLIAAKSDGMDDENANSSMHKVAVTLPVSGDFDDYIQTLPLETFLLGGQSCRICGEASVPTLSQDNSAVSSVQSLPNRRARKYTSRSIKIQSKRRALSINQPKSSRKIRYRALRAIRRQSRL